MNAEELIAFEKEIADTFCEGKIRAPVHLAGGNESQLIHIFKMIPQDAWVFSTHRSHYHALLHGVPKEKVKEAILRGDSIHLWFPEYHFYTSAIVAGIVPIALGAAMAGHESWVFVGDMCARTGIFHECVSYAHAFGLPIHFVIEDNGMSVDTPTEMAWGDNRYAKWKVDGYTYERTWPHQGAGKFVVFA